MAIDTTKKVKKITVDGALMPFSSAIDANITAENIKKDVTVLGVTGTYNDRLPSLIQKTITSVKASDFGDMTSIPRYLFENCTRLISVKFPNSITTIGLYSFFGCSSLREVDLKYCTGISSYAFCGCSSLNRVTFYSVFIDKLKSIGINTFENCSNLSTISLGKSLTSIGSNAFKGCTRLGQISVSNSNTAFSADSETKRLLVQKSSGEIVASAMYGTSSYTIPDKMTPTSSNIRRIGSYAFYGFTNLQRIALGRYIEGIDSYAFADSGLIELQINRTTPPTLVSTDALPSTITRIEVPSGSLSAYQSATNWSTFANKMIGV